MRRVEFDLDTLRPEQRERRHREHIIQRGQAPKHGLASVRDNHASRVPGRDGTALVDVKRAGEGERNPADRPREVLRLEGEDPREDLVVRVSEDGPVVFRVSRGWDGDA